MLLTLDPAGVKKLIERYDKDVADIKKSCLQLAWYMRGGSTYTDILNMSNDERNAINQIVEQNLETTKNSGLPFY